MSGMAALAAALDGGLRGFMRGEQYMRGKEREDKEAAFKDEQLAYMRDQQARTRKEWAATDAIESAAAPTTVQEQSFAAPTTGPTADAPMVTRFDTAGATFADKAKAEAAARLHNSPVATYTRMGDEAKKRGKADLAKTYGEFSKHAESNGFLALHAANAPVGITAEDIKAGKVPDADVMGLDEFNKTGAYQLPEGVRRKFIVDDLGRPDYILTDKEGKQIGSLSGGQIQSVYDKATARQNRQDTINRQDKESDNKRADAREAAQERRWQERTQLAREQIGATMRAASIRASAGAAAPTPAPVWDKDADKVLLKHYTVTDPTSGADALDGDGLQFGKQVALARARAGGGDTTMAIGYAVAKDAQIRKLAGNDPVKLQQLRAGYLASLSGQGQDAQAPKPAAPAAAQQPQPKPGPSIQAVAKPVNDSMADNPQMAAGITQAIEQLRQVQQFAAAAAKSGDAKAAIQWGDKVNAARAQAVGLISKLPKAQQDQLMGSL